MPASPAESHSNRNNPSSPPSTPAFMSPLTPMCLLLFCRASAHASTKNPRLAAIGLPTGLFWRAPLPWSSHSSPRAPSGAPMSYKYRPRWQGKQVRRFWRITTTSLHGQWRTIQTRHASLQSPGILRSTERLSREIPCQKCSFPVTRKFCWLGTPNSGAFADTLRFSLKMLTPQFWRPCKLRRSKLPSLTSSS